MDQRELVAIVVTADGKRVPVRLGGDPERSLIARLQQRLRRLLGL